MTGHSRDNLATPAPKHQYPNTTTNRAKNKTKHAGMFTCYRNEKMEVKALFLNILKLIYQRRQDQSRDLSLPLKKNIRSLNISMAVAITLSEALRQSSNFINR